MNLAFKIKSLTRYRDWWGYRLPVFLAIGYATALQNHIDLPGIIVWLLFLLAAIIVGAIYVSVINDLTDIEIDLKSNKFNIFGQIPKFFRWLLPIVCIAIGLALTFFVYPDKLSVSLYFLSWIAYALYSLPPARLKTRGSSGLFADAFGSLVLPNLFILTSMSYHSNQPVNWEWFTIIAIWSVIYGLRGALCHQFFDRNNDIKAGVKNYATNTDPESFKKVELLLLFIEVIAFGSLLFQMGQPVLYTALILYLVFGVFRHRAGVVFIYILPSKAYRFHSFMFEYYQTVFPVSILLIIALSNPTVWFILITHVLLFPGTFITAIKDAYIMFKKPLLSKTML